MLKQLRKKTDGFTIIEVMIVLAIAGLIMLIVFLAVPALQRNQRNSARRSEAGRYAAAVNEFVANNGGTLPVAADANTLKTAVGATLYIDTAPTVVNAAAQNPWTTVNAVRLVTATGANGAQCSGAKTVAGANKRQAAIQYALEPGGIGACINI